MYRVGINVCQQYKRRSDARERTLTSYTRDVQEGDAQYPSNAPDRVLLKTERDQLVQQAIDQLPSKQRIVVTLFYMQQMKYREIAELLDCSEGTVASRLNTAVRNLKSKLEGLNLH